MCRTFAMTSPLSSRNANEILLELVCTILLAETILLVPGRSKVP